MKRMVNVLWAADRVIYASVFVILVFAFAIALQSPAEISEGEALPAPKISFFFEFLTGKAEAFSFFKKPKIPEWVNKGPVYSGEKKVFGIGITDTRKVKDHNVARIYSLDDARNNLEKDIAKKACEKEKGNPPVSISIPYTEDSYIFGDDYFLLVSIPKDYYEDIVKSVSERCEPVKGLRIVEISGRQSS